MNDIFKHIIIIYNEVLKNKGVDFLNQEFEYKMNAVMDIIQSPNTMDKIMKFRFYSNELKDCRIILFDEQNSNFDKNFKNKRIGKCEILGLADYTKTWILDSNHISDETLVQAGKTIDFDLNILTYLNKIFIGRDLDIDKNEVLDYLNYLKIHGFQYGIVTALMERMTKRVDLNILAEMITSFVKFDNISSVYENLENIHLSTNDYSRIKKIYDTTLEQSNQYLVEFNLLCCAIMKAYLIKKDCTLSKEKKIENIINYCLDTLNCYLEKEIVILSLYVIDNCKSHETFKKIKDNSEIIDNILNVTWDIYHIRLLEKIMLSDNIKDKDIVMLSYYGTADKGIINAMAINPVKAFIIIDKHSYPIHQLNIEDVCKNEEILENVRMNAELRKRKIKQLDFMEIRKNLECEILESINQKKNKNF